MIKTDVRDLIQRLYQTAREAHPESQEVFKHICWESADLIDSFDQRVADLEDEVGELESKYFTLNQLYNEQVKQIEKLDNTRIEYIGRINKLVEERGKLRKTLKPFAAYYETDCTDLDPDYCVICEADEEEHNLTVGLFRAAHKVLEGK